MRTDPLGDSALILRDFDFPAYQVAETIQNAGLPGLVEAVASYETVGVYFDPKLFDPETLFGIEIDRPGQAGKLHEIPVCYELGEDLSEVAEKLGLSIEAVIELHTSTVYRCFAVGFCPGFPYLGYLPDALAGIPRRSSPRVRITPGSVAITGRQTGIYPLERPGGWAILGRTPLCLVDVDSAYFPIKAGDEIRFTAIGLEAYQQLANTRL